MASLRHLVEEHRFELVRLSLAIFLVLASGLALPAGLVGIAKVLYQPRIEQQEDATAASIASVRGPRVLKFVYGDETRTSEGKSSPYVPRSRIAKLLDTLRESRHRPVLVYVDVALGIRSDDESGDRALATAISSWRATPGLPPLVIDAGTSCGPSDPSEAQAVEVLDPGPLAKLVAIPIQTPAASSVTWSCPMFSGLHQVEWSCVHLSPSMGGGIVALPSPAWVAAGLGKMGRDGVSRLLKSATLRCQHSPAGLDRASESRVHLDPGSESRLSDGRFVGKRLSLEDVVSLDPQELGGAIVVVGATTSLCPDVQITSLGPVQGVEIVAATLREAFVFGLPDTSPSRWIAVLVGAVVLSSYALVRIVLPRLRTRLLRRMRSDWVRPLVFVAFQDVITIALLTAVAALTLRVIPLEPSIADLVATCGVVAFVVLETLLLLNTVEKEWKHEKDDLTRSSPHRHGAA